MPLHTTLPQSVAVSHVDLEKGEVRYRDAGLPRCWNQTKNGYKIRSRSERRPKHVGQVRSVVEGGGGTTVRTEAYAYSLGPYPRIPYTVWRSTGSEFLVAECGSGYGPGQHVLYKDGKRLGDIALSKEAYVVGNVIVVPINGTLSMYPIDERSVEMRGKRGFALTDVPLSPPSLQRS